MKEIEKKATVADHLKGSAWFEEIIDASLLVRGSCGGEEGGGGREGLLGGGGREGLLGGGEVDWGVIKGSCSGRRRGEEVDWGVTRGSW